MKTQLSYSTTALKAWAEFMDKLQTTYLRRLAERIQQMQQPEAQTSSSQLFAASSDPSKALSDSLSFMAPPDPEAKKNQPACYTPASTEKIT